MASVGLRARPLRAALSALGIAIGTAAIVAVLGLSSSSQAGLLAEIDRLGTNLLTVEAGQRLTGGAAKLPVEAPGRITLLDDVQRLAHTGLMKDEKVYRSSLIPVANSGGLQVRATSLNLLSGARHRRRPRQLAQRGHRPRAGRRARGGRGRAPGHRPRPRRSADLAGRPVVQRRGHPGALAAGDRHRHQRPRRLPRRPEVPRLRQHRPAASRPAGPPSTIYVRTATGHEAAVQALLAPTANPEAPDEVNVSQPSDVLTARAAAAGAVRQPLPRARRSWP